MSGFDDNPFADPFAEPSIQQATRTAPAGLEEYDPFGPPNAGVAAPAYVEATVPGGGNDPPTVTPTTATNPPQYTTSSQQQATVADFQRRQEELERKAQELARKEEELKAAGAAQVGGGANNWPPLPAACPVGPCFYQDISVDIPLEFQKIVRMLYYLWMFNGLMLLLNILGGLGVFIGLGSGSTFGLAIVYFAVFTPFSYVCWFRPVYKAFRNDSSFNFMVFFFIFSAQIVVSVINAIGLPTMGTCGWVMVGQAFNAGSIGLGIFLTLIAVCASGLAAYMAFAILWVHRIYRSTGASFAKAQAEFSQGVMRNEHVQQVATNAASAAVRSQLSGDATTTGPRF